MKSSFWRFVFYADIFACLIAGVSILLSRADKAAVLAFYITWIILVIFIKVIIRRNKK